MKFALKAASVLTAAAILTACGSFSPSTISSSPAARPNAPAFPAARPDTRKSWLAPDVASSSQLLFVPDLATRDVYIFALPDLKLKGRLTGFKLPTTACSDNHGDVWVADYGTSELLEYSHEGKRLAKIGGIGPLPYGCAVNPVNGAIAVVNYFGGRRGGPGEVLVFSSPSAKPVVLRNPDLNTYYNAAYDSSGNLWVTGYGVTAPMVSKCGPSSCQTVVLSGGSIFSPGPIAWNNSTHEMIVFDQYCHESTSTCSYPVSATGVVGKPTVYLSQTGGSVCSMTGAALVTIGGKPAVVGADNEAYCSGSTSVDLWVYPTGGTPNTTGTGVIYPFGAAVSTK